MLIEEKKSIGSKFKIEDTGEVKHVLGMLIKRDRRRGKMRTSQSNYLEGILKRFGMEQCKPVSTLLEPGKHYQELPDDENPTNVNEYQKLIGCLTYASTATRPDLAYWNIIKVYVETKQRTLARSKKSPEVYQRYC